MFVVQVIEQLKVLAFRNPGDLALSGLRQVVIFLRSVKSHNCRQLDRTSVGIHKSYGSIIEGNPYAWYGC